MNTSSFNIHMVRKRYGGLQKPVLPNTPGDYLVRIFGGPYVNLSERGKRVGLKQATTSNFIHNVRYPLESHWNELRRKLMETFPVAWAKDGTGDALDQAMQKVFAERKQAQEVAKKGSLEKTTPVTNDKATEATDVKAAPSSKGTRDWREASSIFVRKYITRKKLTVDQLAQRSPEQSPLKDVDLWKRIITNTDKALPTTHYIAVVEEICRQGKLKETLVDLDIYQRAQLLLKHLRKLDAQTAKPV